MSGIKAIIHDWDDTITSSFDTYSTWYPKFSKFHKLPDPDLSRVKEAWGLPIFDIISNLYPEVPSEKVPSLIENFLKSSHYNPLEFTPPPFDGVVDTLSRLHQRELVLGVISSGVRDAVLRAYNSALGTDHNFHKFVHTADDLQFHKPDPRVFDPAFEMLAPDGIGRESVVYVGDSLVDYAAAKNAGIQFVGVTTGIIDRDQFLDAGVDRENVLDSFTQIEELLD